MTYTITPPPPPPPTPDYNRWADYWYYEIGVSVIPADTKKKKTWIKWSQYQIQPVSEEQFQEWKRQDAFKDGMAIIVGRVWRGPYRGSHLIFLDLDNKKAIEEFCTREGVTVSLDKIAKKFIVEQHRDDPNKCHVFFYSEIPFEKKSSDIITTTPPLDSRTPPESIPAFEVKGKGIHGIAYVTPSIHKNGHQYEIIGTTEPVSLNPSEAHGMMDHLDAICRKHKLKYLKDSGRSGYSYDDQNRSIIIDDNDNDDGGGSALGDEVQAEAETETEREISASNSSADELFQDGVVIYTGHNRHLAMLRAAESLIRKFYREYTEEEIKEMAWRWNLKHCREPLDEKEFQRQWRDAKNFIYTKLKEEGKLTSDKSVSSGNGNGKSKEATRKDKDKGKRKDKKEKVAGEVAEPTATTVDDGGEGTTERTARAKKALQLAMTKAEELFLNEFGRAFAAIKMIDGHIEIHPMDENKFKNWISGLYYKYYDQLLGEDDLSKIVRILTSQAEHDSSIKRYRLDVRVRGYNSKEESAAAAGEDVVGTVGDVGIFSELMEDFDTIYYDLTNKNWEAIRITSKGWDIDKHPPYLFRRYGAELPQVYPDRNYSPDVLDQYFELWNFKTEYKEMQKLLQKVKHVTDLWPNTTAKPIIILPSSQGTGKTTSFELNKDLIDPNSALTMSFPKDDNQLKQALAHNYMSFFDNLSWISDEQSNTLCRAVTGSGDFKRALFENDTDVIYAYRRIIGLNGITNVATRPDLLERALIVLFGDISRGQRELLRIIRRRYLALKPKVLGFLLDVVSEIMAEREKWKGVDEDYFGLKDIIDANGGLPRMADWAILGEQAAAIIARKDGRSYEQGTFLKVFDENLKILNIEAIKASLVAEALITFLTTRKAEGKGTTWEGSPTLLLAELNTFIIYNRESIRINTDSKAWPQNPSLLGKEIAQIAPNLRALGITIEVERTETNILYKIAIAETSAVEGGGR